MDMFITLIMVMYHGCMPKQMKRNLVWSVQLEDVRF
jgi:hypothetical protein